LDRTLYLGSGLSVDLFELDERATARRSFFSRSLTSSVERFRS
jgi:hypothetical protein